MQAIEDLRAQVDELSKKKPKKKRDKRKPLSYSSKAWSLAEEEEDGEEEELVQEVDHRTKSKDFLGWRWEEPPSRKSCKNLLA